MTPILQIVTLAACVAIFFRAEPVLNQMGRDCKMAIRLAFWLLGAGSMAIGTMILTGWQPTAPVTFALVGTALLLQSERRVRNLRRFKS